MAGPSFKIEWRGLQAFLDYLDAYPEEILHAAEGALFVEAEQTMTEAKKETPVDDGILRASGHVLLPVREGDSVVVELGFGGPAGSGNHGETNTEDVGYAVYVHEDLTARHAVGNAKYLEAPLNRRRSGLVKRLAQRMKRRLGMV